MLDNLNAPRQPPPGARLNIFQTWLLALLPSEKNYARIAGDPGASLGRAYVWLLLAALIGGAINTLINAVVELIIGPSTNPFLQSVGQGTVTGQTLLVGVLCGVPIQAVLALVGITIAAGLSHGLASALGGRGSFTQLVYAISAYAVPFILFDSLISGIPCINLLIILTIFYALALNIVATKAVYQFGWGLATVSSVVVPIGALVLIACAVSGTLVLLRPGIGNIFSNIVKSI